mmetsp:Transcript_126242/g.188388  ORF Transcript_126242/g.188388 Transcript_126242/m.188388 type:complete len:379 (+) Transcript_126242:11-1147(+)
MEQNSGEKTCKDKENKYLSKAKSIIAWVNSDMKPWRKFYNDLPFAIGFPIEAFDVLLRGVGQVVLMNNSITGLFILIGLFYANWWISLCGVIGLCASTLTAILCGFNAASIRDGLHGYNGLLVGLALATFCETYDYLVIIPILITSAMTSVFLAYHTEVFSVPACTLPFCFATSLLLLGSYSLSYFSFPNIGTYLIQAPTDPYRGFEPELFFKSILTGTSQIFVASNYWTGLLILIGICFCSRISAVMCAFGSMVGLCFAFGMGVDRSSIYFGLWGYSAALSAICIGGMFFKFSISSFLYSFVCCIGTCIFHAALVTVFAPWGIPVLTFPFNFGVLLFLVAHTSFKPVWLGHLQHVPLSKMVTPETTLFSSEVDYVAI